MSRTGSGGPARPGHGRSANHHHHKGVVCGGVLYPQHANIGGSRGGDLRLVAAPAPNTRRPSARLVKRQQDNLEVGRRTQDRCVLGSKPGAVEKHPLGSQIPIWYLRPPIGIVFHGGDDGEVVSAPFALHHPHFLP